jgi:hypothetical protein
MQYGHGVIRFYHLPPLSLTVPWHLKAPIFSEKELYTSIPDVASLIDKANSPAKQDIIQMIVSDALLDQKVNGITDSRFNSNTDYFDPLPTYYHATPPIYETDNKTKDH